MRARPQSSHRAENYDPPKPIQFGQSRLHVDLEFDNLQRSTGIRKLISTVAGQNANNTVRVNDTLIFVPSKAAGDWDLTSSPHHRQACTSSRSAESPPTLWDDIGHAVWAFGRSRHPLRTPRSTTGTPARPRARSVASNSCSEYLFLDDTGCDARLASTCMQLPHRGRWLRPRRYYEHAVPPLDHRARDLGPRWRQYPERAPSPSARYDFRHAGARLCQSWRLC